MAGPQTLNLTSSVGGAEGGYPIFASKNYVNQDSIDYGTFSATEMSALMSRIIDGDPFSYFAGSSTDDTVDVVFSISLQSRTTNITRTMDLFILQNINWKNFKIEYSTDGGATMAGIIPGFDYRSGVANNAATDLIVNVAAGLAANFLKITASKTIVANQIKQLGGFIACLSTIQLPGGFIGFKTKNREGVREVEYGDKSISREYILRSAADYQFFGAMFDCPYVAKADLLSLEAIKRGTDNFILVLEPGDDPRRAYLCTFDGPWGHEYAAGPVRSAGYLIPMKVKEVGSH